MTLNVKTSQGNYDIFIQRGGLQKACEVFRLNRKVLVVTDSGVPETYSMTLASQCADATIFVFEQGETSKTLDTYAAILRALVENHFTRTDCVVAVGGGVVGDMAGFAAATYMRGIDFYNVPTTVLSQVDSSIGGKTAIDFQGYKNLVGAFYPPKAVLIDPDVLSTLPQRHIRNGLAESVKMAATHDAQLFELLEKADVCTDILDEVIVRSLTIKKMVVEADERESGQRQVLNFGHTLGHGVESVSGLYHGECVAIGMMAMCSPAVKDRLTTVLERWGLPTEYRGKADSIIEACRHDKKADGAMISIVYVPEVGQYKLKKVPFDEFERMAREVLN